MANRRMISKSISVSERVNSLSAFAALLFTWMIPHADDFGRMHGSAAKVKALVIPMRNETIEDVESALNEIASKGLIVLYTVDGARYVQFPGWEKHQKGLHKRTSSAFPEPSGNFSEILGQPNSTELNSNLTKERDIAIQQIVQAYEESVGTLKEDPEHIIALLDYMDEGMDLELVLSAIRKSAKADVPLRYANTILSNQLRKGIRTVSQIQPDAGGVNIAIRSGTGAGTRQENAGASSLIQSIIDANSS